MGGGERSGYQVGHADDSDLPCAVNTDSDKYTCVRCARRKAGWARACRVAARPRAHSEQAELELRVGAHSSCPSEPCSPGFWVRKRAPGSDTGGLASRKQSLVPLPKSPVPYASGHGGCISTLCPLSFCPDTRSASVWRCTHWESVLRTGGRKPCVRHTACRS